MEEMEHRTCEICGDESSRFEFEDLTGHAVHKGLCFLEYGLIQNTLSGSAFRAAIEKFGALHRERGAAWRLIAEKRSAEVAELRAALFIAPCLCSGGFRCSRCKALNEDAPGAAQRVGEFLPPTPDETIGYLESEVARLKLALRDEEERVRSLFSEARQS